MKVITTIILLLNMNLAHGQDTFLFGVTTPKGAKGHITDPHTIVYSGKLDFDFYKKHFSEPYYYPTHLTDSRHKNDTVTIWNDSTKVGDLKSNWNHTIIYDSLSRVVSYRYSSCWICSQFSYDYHFFYNQYGQVIKMTNNLNDDQTIEFKYDAGGNIVKVMVYRNSELMQGIELINK